MDDKKAGNEAGSALRDSPVASAVVSACEEAWKAIRERHPEVPEAVQVLGTGVERGRLVKLGHWWGGRWVADGEIRGEVLLAGEALHLPPDQVFEVLLHEAAHGLNATRGIKDTSRGGRYHNARYRAAAEEVGLHVEQAAPYGWAKTSLGQAARTRYSNEIERLGEAMRLARRVGADVQASTGEGGGVGEDGAKSGGSGAERGSQAPATCGCGRKMRMAPSVLAQGPVLCGLCGQEFSVGQVAEKARVQEKAALPLRGASNASANGSFLERRSKELAAEGERRPAATPPTFAHPSRQAELTATQQQGLAEIQRLVETGTGAALIGQVYAWRAAERLGEASALVGTNSEEVTAANRTARAVLKLEGELTEPAIDLNGDELLVGEQVMVTHHGQGGAHADDLPSPGMLGTVEVIDVERGEIEVDFPIAGRYTFSADDPASVCLTYGYAEQSEQLGAPLVDLRYLPNRAPEPTHVADVVGLDL